MGLLTAGFRGGFWDKFSVLVSGDGGVFGSGEDSGIEDIKEEGIISIKGPLSVVSGDKEAEGQPVFLVVLAKSGRGA